MPLALSTSVLLRARHWATATCLASKTGCTHSPSTTALCSQLLAPPGNRPSPVALMEEQWTCEPSGNSVPTRHQGNLSIISLFNYHGRLKSPKIKVPNKPVIVQFTGRLYSVPSRCTELWDRSQQRKDHSTGKKIILAKRQECRILGFGSLNFSHSKK